MFRRLAVAALIVFFVSCSVFAETSQNQRNGIFSRYEVVDDFGNPTRKWYLETAMQCGSYKDQDAQNGKLNWKCSFKDDGVCFYLYRDGKDQDISLYEEYTVKIYGQNGEQESFTGTVVKSPSSHSNGIRISRKSVGSFDRNGSVSIVITTANCTYELGTMETEGIGSFYYYGRGPAGGWIFYDCDADNESGNADGLISSECGWRYLEAAPEDLPGKYLWGTDGPAGTGTAIGSGKENTAKISESRNGEVSAAKACLDYSVNGYDDWFLPSKDELGFLYRNLAKYGIGSFDSSDSYWSSSEDNDNFAWGQNVNIGYLGYSYRGYYYFFVRPVRAF